ncbi:leukocyte-associated immunoglobulin-like receptor 1 [Tenrec ecaudatus]|uniref:leukocyte-associated immunoglobulin-like receptor 1 n=1 Tax=Tenrec ecaudatus TaxID=94439 RepID=UPI003F590365
MSPAPTILLSLALCLGPAIQAQYGDPDTPSISVEPGSVVPSGSSVTFICRGTRWTAIRLEKFEPNLLYQEKFNNPLGDETEARFHFPTLYILIGISVAVVLGLLFLVLFLLHCQRQRKRGTRYTKRKDENPQKRFSPGGEVLKSTPEATTVDGLPEKDGERDTSTPAAGGPQDVTYAQLNQQALTRGAAQSGSWQLAAESTTYAAINKH